MNGREIINLLALTAIAFSQSQVVAQSTSVDNQPMPTVQRAEAEMRLLVLKNGNVISGQVSESEEGVVVQTEQGSRLVIATEQADFICKTHEEAYWGKLSRTQASDLKKQVSLFHWCLNQKLLFEAQNQLDILQASELSAVDLDRLNRSLQFKARQEAKRNEKVVKETGPNEARRNQKQQDASQADKSLLAAATQPSNADTHKDPRFLTPIMPQGLTAPYQLVPLSPTKTKQIPTDSPNKIATMVPAVNHSDAEAQTASDLVQSQTNKLKPLNAIVSSSPQQLAPPPVIRTSNLPQMTFRDVADEKPFSGAGALSIRENVAEASFGDSGISKSENIWKQPELQLSSAPQPAAVQSEEITSGIDVVFTPLPKMDFLSPNNLNPNALNPNAFTPFLNNLPNNSQLAISNLPDSNLPDSNLPNQPVLAATSTLPTHVIPTATHPTANQPIVESNSTAEIPTFAAIRSPMDEEPTTLVDESRVIQVGYSEAILPSPANSAGAPAKLSVAKKFIPATIPQLQELTRSMPSGSLVAFRQQVENVLVRNCARCHDSKSVSMPLMHAGKNRNIPRRQSQRNLHSILHYLDRSNPLESPLLKLATTMHGGADTAGLSEDSQEFANLKRWLVLVSDRPELANETNVSNDVEAGDSINGIQEPPKMDTPVKDAQPLKELSPRGDGFIPRDEFDPEIFNRQFGEGSK